MLMIVMADPTQAHVTAGVVCPMRAALLGVACLRVFVRPLSVSLVGFGVWYAVEVRSAGYRERCAGACRCIYYCLTVLLVSL